MTASRNQGAPPKAPPRKKTFHASISTKLQTHPQPQFDEQQQQQQLDHGLRSTATTTYVSTTTDTFTNKKRVFFAPMADCYYFAARREPQDLWNSWYQDTDYALFEEETLLTVAAVRHVRGDLRRLNAELFTVTGLEKILSKRQVMERKRKSMLHVQTVVKQQHHCPDDPVKLQRVSELFSKQPLRRAHIRGILDQTLLL